jgi:hypothetical protein
MRVARRTRRGERTPESVYARIAQLETQWAARVAPLRRVMAELIDHDRSQRVDELVSAPGVEWSQ